CVTGRRHVDLDYW
nr:immunoglobulin heavy chain junction region [Macaca mulatta]MOX58642.1 immunoglobulin heavy chain junction region [Macaca mulatta]MOX59013.1 immunoglobulin heavy chain junction region [Macaca mulatta]MOX59418.1 immunoglobulin heavy chain junction region [Macaca mulatta]MOX59547.1 immunoglobulin heavy chain junction region [Macaca mulatta]